MLYYVQIFSLHYTTKCTQRLWGIDTFVRRAQVATYPGKVLIDTSMKDNLQQNG